MEDFTPVYHGFQPGTGLRCTLHRKKQRQQTTLIGCARILAPRLAERKVLGLAVGGSTPRAGGAQDREQEVARHSPPPTRDARAASGSVPGKRSRCGKRIRQKGLLATAWLRLPVPLRKSWPLFTRNLQSGGTMVKFSSFGLI